MNIRYLFLAVTVMLAAATTKAAQVGQHTWAAQSQLAEGRWLKVSLDGTDDGIYQITYDWLRSQGFANPERVGIYGYGGHQLSEAMTDLKLDDLPEVATYRDDANNRILFYGQGMITWNYNATRGFYHRQNAYDTKAYYFLHEKSVEEGDVCKMDSLQCNLNDLPQCETVKEYDVHFVHEVDEVNLGQTGRELYGESFLLNKSQTFDFETVAAGSVRVTTNFVAYSSESSSITVTLNGTVLGNGTISKTVNEYAFASETNLDKTTTLDKGNGLSVNITYNAPAISPSVARLNYIRVQAKRNFEKPSGFELFRNARNVNRQLCFDLGTAASDEEIQVWDVTSPCNVFLQEVSQSGMFCTQSKGLREYALVNVKAKSFASVNYEGEIENQNLHALPSTNMVIITAPAYRDHAEQLAQYRRTHDRLHVTVLTPEEIYNEFSSGKQDITAFRLLMKMFYDRYHLSLNTDSVVNEPRYLLLWGDGQFNNKEMNRQYMLPCYETEASLVETSSCVCDDYFGFLDDEEGGKQNTSLRYTINENGVDLGIGRLPVSSREQSAGVLRKILSYSENHAIGAWKNRLCFLSDDDKISSEKGSDAINCHMLHNEEMVFCLEQAQHHEFVMQKIYLPAYKQTKSASGTDYPDAKKEFQDALKQGVLIVNYAGHGNTTAITNENMMTADMAQKLSMKYLPLWVTASCDVSRWDATSTSMGECLLLNPDGGAIALFSTVRVVYAQQNKQLNRAMIANLFNRFDDGTRYRLGDIMRSAKLALGTDENKLNFCLLGDPSLVLAYPEQQVQLTEINGQSTIDSNEIHLLPTLSKVNVKGRVLKTGSTSEIDSTFNGLIYPTFYDAADMLVANKGLIQDENNVVTFASRNKKAFAGRAEVYNGEFEVSFTVPIDIAYNAESKGLANFYACSENGEEASGYFDKYMLTGTDDYTMNDTIGPVIKQLFLNSKEWQDGDVVNSTPYFYAEVQDESGFNATGNTVGHDIVLTIRCTSNLLLAAHQHILNNYFTTFTNDPTTGNVQYSIPELEDGTYEATFRIWDVYNNPTTRSFTFTVHNQKAPETVVVQAFPCPARMGDTITFRVMHDRPESAQELTLQIYTQTGRKVYETTVNATSASKVYAEDPKQPTHLTYALNADESSDFMGSATIEWNSSALRPGFYLYRVFLSSNGSTEVSKSELLMVNP